MICRLTRQLGNFFIICLCLVAHAAVISAHDFGGASMHGESPEGWSPSSGGGGGQAGPNNQKNNTGGNIYMYDGSEYYETTDLNLKGVFPIVISRTYNNQSTYDSPLGYGWDFVYNNRLFTYADNSAVIRWRTGFKQRFVFSGGGYVSESGASDNLVENGDGTFILITKSGIKWYFDIKGNLTQIEDNHGNNLRLQYSASKQPLAGLSPFSVSQSAQIVSYDYQLNRIEEWNASDSFTGRSVDFDYHATSGRIISCTDFTDRTVSYEHDINGNLIRVNYPEELYIEYSYDDPNDIHNITAFKQGHSTNDAEILYANEYDDQDRVIKQFHANGILEFDYLIPLVKTIITKTIKDEADTILHEFSETVEFDEMGYVIKYTDGDKNVFETVRDSNGNPSREIIWENLGTTTSPILTKYLIVNQTHNVQGDLTSSSVSLKSGEIITSRYTYDHGWLKTWSVVSSLKPEVIFQGENQFEYNSSYPKQISRVQVAFDGTENFKAIDFEYNPDGQLSTMTYPNGDQETYLYTNGFLTNSNGIIFGRNLLGDITSVTDRNNNLTQYDYDHLGRLIRSINAVNEETVFRFSGSNITEIESGIQGVNQGRKINFSHDHLGRVIQTWIDLNGTPTIQRSYAYDSEGNRLKLTNSLNQTLTYSYDKFGRLETMQKPGLNKIVYQYAISHQPTQITDTNGETTVYHYDKLERLIRVVDPQQHATNYSYNAIDKLVKIETAENRTVSFGHDLIGRVIWKKNSLGQQYDYSHDSKGRLVSIKNPEGTITNYQYSSRDLLIEITFPTNPDRTIIFDYDTGDNLINYTDTAISPSPMTTWIYDALNRVDTITHSGINKVLDYDYNRFGLKEKIRCLSGGSELFSYHYVYDDANQIKSITEFPLNKTVNFQHDTEGRLTERTFDSGAKIITDYTTDNLINRIEFKNTSNTIIDFQQFSHDPMGNILSIESTLGSSSFSYDQNYQVILADYPAVTNLLDEQYTYDKNGNRLSSSGFSNWVYDQADQLQSYGNTSFTYDGRGNTISKISNGYVTQFSYDELGNLVAIEKPGVSTQYTYDHLNRRIKKNLNDIKSWYLYDGGKLLAEFNDTGDLLRNYEYSPNSETLLAISDGSSTFSVMTDNTGSPSIVLNDSEVPVWKSTHQTFGDFFIDADPDNDGEYFTLNHRFPGQFHDLESDLYYNIYRYYDPKTGRYIQRDPIGWDYEQPQTLNPYTYVTNNPLTFIDPLGLKRRGSALNVYVLNEEDMKHILRSMAVKLNYEVDYLPWYVVGVAQLYDTAQLIRIAPNIDSVFNDNTTKRGPYSPRHDRLYTFKDDPKGRVYAGNELNYILQGMLYAHLGMPPYITRQLLINGWKRLNSDAGGTRRIKASLFWAERGRKMYSKIMAEFNKNPQWEYTTPNFDSMNTVTLGQDNYHLFTPDPK